MSACEQLLGNLGGKVVVFNSARCNDGVGALKNRLNPKELTSDKERDLFNHTSEHDFYLKLGYKAL